MKGTKGVVSEHSGDLVCTKDAASVTQEGLLEELRAKQTCRKFPVLLVCSFLMLLTWDKTLVGLFSCLWLTSPPWSCPVKACPKHVSVYMNVWTCQLPFSLSKMTNPKMSSLVSWYPSKMKNVSFSDFPVYLVEGHLSAYLALHRSYFSFNSLLPITACCVWNLSCLSIL